MNRALLVAACLSLLLPRLAAAEEPRPPDAHEAPAAHAEPHPAAPRAAPRPAARPAPRPAAHPAARPAATQHAAPRPAARPAPRPAAHPAAAQHAAPRPADRPAPRAAADRDAPRPPSGDHAFHRGQAIARVHAPAFNYPNGYHYQRWSIGARLPGIFYSPNYYYGGWSALGLQAPPPGYEWVRYGPDMVLVNIDTGEVEDVVYGVFL